MSAVNITPTIDAALQRIRLTKMRPAGPYLCCLGLYFALNAHMLRNVSVLYLAALGGIETCALYFVAKDAFKYLRSSVARWYLAFLLASVVGAVQTIYAYGISGGLYACVRFYMVTPLVILSATALDHPRKTAFVMKCFIWVNCLGVGSIALQYITGPISWFAEPGERADIVRFGSLVGSLPMIGAALPLAILGTLMIRMKWIVRCLFLFVLFFGVMISLSKGAIAGTALAITLFLFLPNVNKKQGVAVLAVISLSMTMLAYLAGSGTVLNQARLYVAALFLEDSTGRGGDVTMQQSMKDRWTSLPAQSLGWLDQSRGNLGMITGGGFQMLGAALIPAEDSRYFTSHDTYIDLILIGGLPLLIAYVGLIVQTTRRLRAPPARQFFYDLSEVGSCAFGMMLILIITCLFSAALNFQPVVASMWCVLTGVAIRMEYLAGKGLLPERIERQL